MGLRSAWPAFPRRPVLEENYGNKTGQTGGFLGFSRVRQSIWLDKDALRSTAPGGPIEKKVLLPDGE